jgi:hypothetical protein
MVIMFTNVFIVTIVTVVTKVKTVYRIVLLRKSARKCFALRIFPSFSGFGYMVYSFLQRCFFQLFSLGDHNMC